MWLGDDALARLAWLVDPALPEIPGDRYRIVCRLGEGGMGTVYLAEDLPLQREVAIKVMLPSRDDAAMAERMRQEARIVARIEHSSVVPVHEVGTLGDGRAFYVMRYVRGMTLGAWRERAVRNDALRLFARLCGVVGHAHGVGVVHRDLKPDNVMVGAFGELFVMDWGIAGAASGADAARPAGTPGYMAPEQIAGLAAGPAVDVYALAAILAFLVTGRHPPTSGSLELALLPRPLAAICARGSAIDPAERYPAATDLGDDVTRFLDREPVLAYREPLHERVIRFLGRNQVLVWLIIGYLTLRILVAIWAGR